MGDGADFVAQKIIIRLAQALLVGQCASSPFTDLRSMTFEAAHE
jgi:hypothetical protein